MHFHKHATCESRLMLFIQAASHAIGCSASLALMRKRCIDNESKHINVKTWKYHVTFLFFYFSGCVQSRMSQSKFVHLTSKNLKIIAKNKTLLPLQCQLFFTFKCAVKSG